MTMLALVRAYLWLHNVFCDVLMMPLACVCPRTCPQAPFFFSYFFSPLFFPSFLPATYILRGAWGYKSRVTSLWAHTHAELPT